MDRMLRFVKRPDELFAVEWRPGLDLRRYEIALVETTDEDGKPCADVVGPKGHCGRVWAGWYVTMHHGFVGVTTRDSIRDYWQMADRGGEG